MAAAPLGPLRAGLLPRLPLLRRRTGLAGVVGGAGAGRGSGGGGAGSRAGAAEAGSVESMSCGVAGVKRSAGVRLGKSGSG